MKINASVAPSTRIEGECHSPIKRLRVNHSPVNNRLNIPSLRLVAYHPSIRVLQLELWLSPYLNKSVKTFTLQLELGSILDQVVPVTTAFENGIPVRFLMFIILYIRVNISSALVVKTLRVG